MKKITLIFISFLLSSLIGRGETIPGEWFKGTTMRFDFTLAGDAGHTDLFPLIIKEEPLWGGHYSLPLTIANDGNIRYDIFDRESNTLLYSRGYTTLYQEWQTTAEAKVAKRSFHEVICFPYPNKTIRLVISERERDGTFSTLFETHIDPADSRIIREKTATVKSSLIWGGASPQEAVDILFLAEGYTAAEMPKFLKDAGRMAVALLAEEPYKRYKSSINIWAVQSVSQESGTDIPAKGVYVNTALNSTFSTFGLDRYLTTFDLKGIYDYAAAAPHDNIVVLINSPEYGGGGMYNYYSCTTTDHSLSIDVFLHELGHGFGGLGDEYYSSTVAYEEFYPLKVEPWEPNLTTLVDFSTKWESYIYEGVPVPTPSTEEFRGVVGLFEGGGYMANGIYRPSLTCRMKENGAGSFCEVCQRAIENRIKASIAVK